jgi:GNAT superfamily N-acetyltransferase
MGTVSIVPVTTARQTRQFIEFPYVLYSGHPHWIPPLRRDERRRLSAKHNPFLAHASIALWLAQDKGRVTGRIAAIDDRLHNEKYGEHTTWFGFLEAADAATTQALLEAVEQWARKRGSALVRGPANPSLNESAGLLVEGFDEDPYVLMPYNPPEYAAFVEGAGYHKVKDLLAWSLDLTLPLGERISRLADRARQRQGFILRTVDMRQFDRELKNLLAIYRTAWTDNWGFVPPTDAEISQLAADLRPILDPAIVLFAERAGTAVGCAIAVPDVNQVLKRMHGRLLPFGLVPFLRRGSIINQARALLLGVVPELRRSGLYPLLIAESVRRGVARGYRRAELSWTLEDNDAVNAGIEAAGGVRNKIYRLYERRLGGNEDLGENG